MRTHRLTTRSLRAHLLTGVLLGFTTPSLAFETQTLAQTLAEDATLHDVEFLDAERGWAVGDRGVVLRTEDGGETWRRAETPVSCALHAVSFVDRQRGWVVGGETRPYTHVTAAVVLRTDDGGETWERVQHGPLPKLTAAKFFDRQHGVAAGVGSALAPAGVFETRDGGRSWRTFPAGEMRAWSGGDFVVDAAGEAQGIVVGPRGAVARLGGREVTPADAPGELRGHHAVRWIDPQRAWLVGDGGLVRATLDGGRTWRAPPTDPLAQQPAEVFAAIGDWFDWRAVASREAIVCAVGSPGSAALVSRDGGASWSLHATGVSAPLAAVEFLDTQRGFAVGEMGTILATRNGGETWTAQRGGDRRAGVSVVTVNPASLPAELLATNAVAEGRRASVLAPFSAASALRFADSTGRLREAAVASGADALESDWRLALESGDEALDLDPLSATLDRRIEGDSDQWLAHRVRRHLLTYRPGAVVLTASSATAPEGLALVASKGTLAGVALAAEAPPAWTGLRAWRPTATLAAWPVDSDARGADGAGESRHATGGFSALLGGSPAQWSRVARGLLSTKRLASPAAYAWRSLDESPLSAGRHGDLLAGADSSRPNAARRPAAAPSVDQIDALRRTAQKQRVVEQLLTSRAADPAWGGRVMELTGGLDAESGAALLLQLAEGYADDGRVPLAAETHYLLARRYPGTASGDAALVWLVRYYASGERAHAALRAEGTPAQRSDTLSNVVAGQAAASDQGAPPDEQTTLGAPNPLGADERAARAVRLAEHLEQARPELYADPGLRLAVAAAHRARGADEEAERLSMVLGRQGVAPDWRRAALAQRWLAEPSGRRPEKAVVTCRPSARRPLLDGRLDDLAWREAQAMPLRSDSTVAEATLRLAHDDEFLYVAGEAFGAEPAGAPNSPRTRDEPLDHADRVALRLDIDRDYATAYELTIDSRGHTHDALDGDASWNPRWFVAAAEITPSTTDAPRGWSFEAAIPLSELAPVASLGRAAWAVSAQRLRPGCRPATWGAEPATDSTADPASPDSWGVVVWK
ncbi:MAG: YCF48-related protein [Lacipirellulaceae bacterium]